MKKLYLFLRDGELFYGSSLDDQTALKVRNPTVMNPEVWYSIKDGLLYEMPKGWTVEISSGHSFTEGFYRSAHLIPLKEQSSGISAVGVAEYGELGEGISERYNRIKNSEWFKKAYDGKSIGEEAGIPESGETRQWRFDRKLAVEIMARFTGNSRGTPIAKAAFIDGAQWAYSLKSVSPAGRVDNPYQIIEKFADNGEHSHYELMNNSGEIVWSEESVSPPPQESQEDQDDVWAEVFVILRTAGIEECIERFTVTRKAKP